MTKLLTDTLWSEIQNRVRKSPSACFVAVPYFGKSGHKLLPLERGSVLVVDASLAAVKSGQTHPPSLLALINKGVQVHSVSNLHAKVFVLGDAVIVGSANASYHSRDSLIEAGILSLEPRLVRQAKEFVNQLCGEPVTPEHAKLLARSYRPPRWGPTGKRRGGKEGGRRVKTLVVPRHSPLWLVPVKRRPWDDPVAEQELWKNTPRAQKLLTSSSDYEVDRFLWWGDDLLKFLRPRDLLLQVVT